MQEIRCAFCGGKGCKWENSENFKAYKNTHPAIEGLFSSWITDEILAMARPSQRIIREFELIKQFKSKGIKAVVNLQQLGEHPNCGDGVVPGSGWSYLPETFMEAGISHFGFGWKDMGVPNCDRMLNIVQVISHVIKEGGKVAVHCHAGLGRTGIVIASFLTYSKSMTPLQAIKEVRIHRPKSIQTKTQTRFVFQFHDFLVGLRTLFVVNDDDLVVNNGMLQQRSTLSLDEVMTNQRKLLHGPEGQRFRFVPKIIPVVTERLAELNKWSNKALHEKFLGQQTISSLSIASEKRAELRQLKVSLNEGKWGVIKREDDPWLLLLLICEWLSHLTPPCVSEDLLDHIIRNSEGSSFEVLAHMSPVLVSTLDHLTRLVSSMPISDVKTESYDCISASLLGHSLILTESSPSTRITDILLSEETRTLSDFLSHATFPVIKRLRRVLSTDSLPNIPRTRKKKSNSMDFSSLSDSETPSLPSVFKKLNR